MLGVVEVPLLGAVLGAGLGDLGATVPVEPDELPLPIEPDELPELPVEPDAGALVLPLELLSALL